MAYTNFIPSVWAETINRELEKNLVFAEDCNRIYEGDIKQKGDSVHILGIGKPTIRSIDRKNTSDDIEGPEEIATTSTTLTVNQIRYFNYKVGDIDKAQAVGGLMDALSQETSEALANEMDKYIADMAKGTDAAKMYDADSEKKVDKTNVLDVIDDAIQKLQESDVNMSSDIVLTVSPRFYKIFKQAYIDKNTSNTDNLKNGRVAMYGNVTIKLSNNIAKSADGKIDYIMMKTKRAIAFVNPLTHTEAYRPENSFADAVKGFALFEGKIVRPNELVVLNVKYA